MNRCCSFWGRYSKHPREIWDQESRWRLRRQSRESSLSPSDFSRGEDNLAAEAAWLLGNLNAIKLWAGWIGQTELCRGSQWWSIKLMPRGQRCNDERRSEMTFKQNLRGWEDLPCAEKGSFARNVGHWPQLGAMGETTLQGKRKMWDFLHYEEGGSSWLSW